MASVFVACAEEGVPRTVKDMAAVADEVGPHPHTHTLASPPPSSLTLTPTLQPHPHTQQWISCPDTLLNEFTPSNTLAWCLSRVRRRVFPAPSRTWLLSLTRSTLTLKLTHTHTHTLASHSHSHSSLTLTLTITL